MRRKIAIAITFAVGLYYFLEFVLPASIGGGFDCRRMGSPCLVAQDRFKLVLLLLVILGIVLLSSNWSVLDQSPIMELFRRYQ